MAATANWLAILVAWLNEVEGIALFCGTLQFNHLPAMFTLVFVSTKSIVGYLAGGSFVVSEMLLHC